MTNRGPDTPTAWLERPDVRAEVFHDSRRKWPVIGNSAWWSFVTGATEIVDAQRIIEIGCEYGRHVGEEKVDYTGVDYGYFIEVAHALRPDRTWIKIDFDRYDRSMLDQLFDEAAVYFVRARIEQVRDASLLLDALVEFASRGAVVVIAHAAAEDAGDAKPAPFFRRAIDTEALASGFRDRGLAAHVLGRIPLPEMSSRARLRVVATGPSERIDGLAAPLGACLDDAVVSARIAIEQAAEDAGAEPETSPSLARESEIGPETMLLTPNLPLISSRLMPVKPKNTVISVDDALAAILEAREQRRPMSLIRLGNGEGRVLGFPDFVAPIWLARSLRNWFGSRDAELRLGALQDEAAEMISEADILGVVRKRYQDAQFELPVKLLGLYGLAGAESRFTTPDIHVRALHAGFYERLLAGERGISLVCGHQLAAAVSACFGVDDVRIYKVPAQAKFFFDAEDEAHFPTVFDRLRSEIQVRWPGEIFLVGAGFLGKIYCGWIRRQGGIALDIGSVFDLWAGEHTRGANPEVAARFKLSTGDR